MLQLLENKVDEANFPNIIVKQYLSNNDHREMFRKNLEEIKGFCDSLSLMETIGRNNNFLVSVALTIQRQEKEIDSLKKKVESLEAQLKLQQKPSVFESGHTTFSAPTIPMETPTAAVSNSLNFNS